MSKKNKKYYEDFIGDRIKVKVEPFEFESEEDALKSELWRLIRAKLNYENGLICEFGDIEVVVNKTITVRGTVTGCEVDC